MTRSSIVVIYKNGTSVSVDVPENFYLNKYKKKSEKKLHQIFMKDYKKFVKALNKNLSVVDVNKYLPFSNASICGKDILSVDIKNVSLEEVTENQEISNTYIPSLHDQLFLNIDGTKLEKLLDEIDEQNLVENLSKLIDRLLSYFTKSNVEFTIKAGKKQSTTTRKKKSVTDTLTTIE